MKSKELLRLIFINPFERIAGWQALGLGLIVAVFTIFISSFSNTYFDGALDCHSFTDPFSIWKASVLFGVGLASIILMYLIAGAFFSKNFRIIDVVGTIILTKATNLFSALLSFIPLPDIINDPQKIIESPNLLFSSPTFILCLLLSFLTMVWFITLLYNAFKVSLNIRKNIGVIVFIIAIILAEVLSKVLISII